MDSRGLRVASQTERDDACRWRRLTNPKRAARPTVAPTMARMTPVDEELSPSAMTSCAAGAEPIPVVAFVAEPPAADGETEGAAGGRVGGSGGAVGGDRGGGEGGSNTRTGAMVTPTPCHVAIWET